MDVRFGSDKKVSPYNLFHLQGVGKYGSDSYGIFIRGQLDISVEDKSLESTSNG